jgi:hypothetical protein
MNVVLLEQTPRLNSFSYQLQNVNMAVSRSRRASLGL